MSQGSQMGADLVGAPGVGGSLQQHEALKSFQHEQLGLGGLAMSGVDDSAMAAVAIHAQAQVDAAALPSGHALYQGMVGFNRLALLKLGIQRTMGGSRAGKDDHPAGLAIQSMHHPQCRVSFFQNADQKGALGW